MANAVMLALDLPEHNALFSVFTLWSAFVASSPSTSCVVVRWSQRVASYRVYRHLHPHRSERRRVSFTLNHDRGVDGITPLHGEKIGRAGNFAPRMSRGRLAVAADCPSASHHPSQSMLYCRQAGGRTLSVGLVSAKQDTVTLSITTAALLSKQRQRAAYLNTKPSLPVDSAVPRLPAHAFDRKDA